MKRYVYHLTTLVVLIVPALLAGRSAHAQPHFWIGGISSDWNNEGNWSNAVVPGPGELAVFDDTAESTLVNVFLPTFAGRLDFRNQDTQYVFAVTSQLPTEEPIFQANRLSLTGSGIVTFENPPIFPEQLNASRFNEIDVVSGTLSLGQTGNLIVPLLGQTMIGSSGTLVVADTGARLQSTVLNAGTLGGNGLVQGTVLNNGRIAPGLSPGVLTIDGNFAQTPAGLLEMEIETSDAFDLLKITGAASLAGAVRIVANPNAQDPIGPIVAIEGDRQGVFRPVDTLGGGNNFYVLSYLDTNSTDVFASGYFEGDMNLSGGLPDTDDIAEFVRALRNRDDYWFAYGIEGDEAGDIDDDNDLDFDDVDDFVSLLPPGAGAQLHRLLTGVPEPSTASLLVLAALALDGRRRRRR